MFFILLKVFIDRDFADLLQFELAEIGFDSFWEESEGVFFTSIEEEKFDQEATQVILEKYKQLTKLEYQLEREPKQNWNKTWEENYEPVFIGENCVIRADFHALDKNFEYDIIINPKMSFGTGHHETTALCVEQLMNLDLEGKKVADIGCGTGILSIMALKKGAKEVIACDVEDWAVANAKENIQVNGFSLSKFYVFHGTAAQIQTCDFDVVLANINLNILLAEMPIYSQLLLKGGLLLLSGFYEHEIPQIVTEGGKLGLNLQKHLVKNNWTALLMKKY
ncbi:50S ribosomal protein L11 methyltransferase [Thermoflexibacter ruber]|uniref:Ribosomal protein L11 methyltransferase n=1 Tax=Thermoflexibacter ruber TaxID=1003 RepID=A0A1I2A9Q0_9BACT|nr:50S ribosomal protein L11 methyltransferase [Thermoflexibacter ruber]SFE39723.1 ribosomal protein L11 methyltransferase [Thermoflexibacter ruber]